MKIKNIFLFVIPALIWGTTWYAIKLQLGVVEPIFSVAYRFLIAGFLLLLFCLFFQKSINFSFKNHLLIAAMGLCMYSVNYWFVYLAETNLPSGIVAVLFSPMMIVIIFLNSIFFKVAIQKKVLLAAVIGIIGTILLFSSEISVLNIAHSNLIAFILAFIAVIIGSVANIISAYIQKNNVPIIQTNALGMTYGGLLLLIIAFISGKTPSFEITVPYIASLLYLSIFGSIISFTLYMKLLGKIGPEKSSYVTLVTPVIAMLISTLIEGYQWNVYSILGFVFILVGNIIVLIKK